MYQKNISIVSTEWTQSNIKAHYILNFGLAEEQLFSKSIQRSHKIFGQFAFLKEVSPNIYEAIRDPLGIEKLFYTETKNRIFFAQNFKDLIKFQTDIFSVPRGMHVRIGKSGIRETVNDFRLISSLNLYGYNGTHNFQREIETRIATAFSLIRKLEESGWNVFIALSGGLDSSTIAFKSKKHLKNPIACTVDLGDSEDASIAKSISKTIEMKHLVFETSESEIKSTLANAPQLCQDFRDFNVHCAVLNIILAKNIRNWADDHLKNKEKLIILTGDLMNEFTCDYSEEIIGGKKYYRLPRVSKKNLQNNLIGSVDTSDREISPFRNYGIRCIQPYAILYDLYSSLPSEALEDKDAKLSINSFLVPQKILQHIPKNKLRAQVGGIENKGILGLCHKLDINEEFFTAQLLKGSGGTAKNIPIVMGRYDTETFSALK